MMDKDVELLFENRLNELRRKEAYYYMNESASANYGINCSTGEFDFSDLTILDLAYTTDISADLKTCLFNQTCK